MKNASLLLLLFLNFGVKAQYKNLIMEGSGVKAFAYVGVLAELEKQNKLTSLERIGGTSGGAIIACLYAIGYTPAEMEKISYQIPVQKFRDKGPFWKKSQAKIFKTFGWYKGDAFERWLEKLVLAKTGNKDITLQELHEQKNEKNYKDLFLVVTDLSIQKSLVLSHKYYGQVRIVDAVRASMSIPLFYNAVFVDSHGKRVARPTSKNKNNIHIWVDGGVLSNYPIMIFDSTCFTDNVAQADNQYQWNRNTLGILLESGEFADKFYNIKNISSYINALYHTTIDKPLFSAQDIQRTIQVQLDNVSPMVKKIPKKTMDYMISQGRVGAIGFLRRSIAY